MSGYLAPLRTFMITNIWQHGKRITIAGKVTGKVQGNRCQGCRGSSRRRQKWEGVQTRRSQRVANSTCGCARLILRFGSILLPHCSWDLDSSRPRFDLSLTMPAASSAASSSRRTTLLAKDHLHIWEEEYSKNPKPSQADREDIAGRSGKTVGQGGYLSIVGRCF